MAKVDKKHKHRAEDIRLFALREAGDAGDRGAPATGLVAKVAGRFAISRQAAHRHVHALVGEGSLISSGANRGRSYQLAVLEGNDAWLELKGLEEHAVWRSHIASLMEAVPGPAVELAHFCFTEMVNNAIDHSSGTLLYIKTERTPLYVRMKVGDNGVGIFRKIREALSLDDDRHAMLELTKGKFTTDPKTHSGLGIFFSSKSCDKLSITSGRIYFGHFRLGPDWLMDDLDDTEIDGTHVTMTIDLDTSRRLNAVFDEYSTPNNPGFSRTTIPVKVAQYGDENLISRSQAKRVLARVEKFKEVMFDFDGVSMIGQSFGDEIFRVFAQEHPDVSLIPVRTNAQVQGMIDLALQSRHAAPTSK
jgi:hypothetical protein